MTLNNNNKMDMPISELAKDWHTGWRSLVWGWIASLSAHFGSTWRTGF